MNMSAEPGDVAVFWDLENCNPDSSGGYNAVQKVLSIALTFGPVRLFKVYVDSDLHFPSKSPIIQAELQSCGACVTECFRNSDAGERADIVSQMILVDMLMYSMDTHGSSTIVLFTGGNRNFAYAFSMLRMRKYKVVLIAPESVHISSKMQASLYMDWNGDVIDARTTKANQDTSPLHEQRSPGASAIGAHNYDSTRMVDAFPSRHRSVTSSPMLRDRSPAFLVSHTRQATPIPFSRTSSPGDSRRAYNGHPFEGTPKASHAIVEEASLAEFQDRLGTPHGVLSAVRPFPAPGISPHADDGVGTASAVIQTQILDEVHPGRPRKIVPRQFRPLVERLQHYRNGIERPLRSALSSDLIKVYPAAYETAGVKKFLPYATMAKAAGIVELGGEGINAWVALEPEWYDADTATE